MTGSYRTLPLVNSIVTLQAPYYFWLPSSWPHPFLPVLPLATPIFAPKDATLATPTSTYFEFNGLYRSGIEQICVVIMRNNVTGGNVLVGQSLYNHCEGQKPYLALQISRSKPYKIFHSGASLPCPLTGTLLIQDLFS